MSQLTLILSLQFLVASIGAGPGIMHWKHYFAVYERHFARFRGTDCVLAEVGIFSGGSLKMWRWYLGDAATIIGIDISNDTRIYERNPEYGSPDHIVIGDQSDPDFWRAFQAQHPRLNILIDDGGHRPFQQIATLEAMLPHLQPGGVFFCEDVRIESKAPQ